MTSSDRKVEVEPITIDCSKLNIAPCSMDHGKIMIGTPHVEYYRHLDSKTALKEAYYLLKDLSFQGDDGAEALQFVTDVENMANTFGLSDVVTGHIVAIKCLRSVALTAYQMTEPRPSGWSELKAFILNFWIDQREVDRLQHEIYRDSRECLAVLLKRVGAFYSVLSSYSPETSKESIHERMQNSWLYHAEFRKFTLDTSVVDYFKEYRYGMLKAAKGVHNQYCRCTK